LVTSPAKAGPVKAIARANANVEMSAFMDILLWSRGVPQKPWPAANGSSVSRTKRKYIRRCAAALDHKSTQFYRLTLMCVVKRRSGGLATMSYLFAAVLLLSSPGCPHEEPTCLTPTEYVEVNLRPGVPPGQMSLLEALRLEQMQKP
jgi:hypothetical protein